MTGAAVDAAPDWSPDGRRIAFMRLAEPGTAIWMINADGRGLRRLATAPPAGVYRNPSWSPDARHLVFEQLGPSLKRGKLLLLDVASGTRRTTGVGRAVNGQGLNFDPEWAPRVVG